MLQLQAVSQSNDIEVNSLMPDVPEETMQIGETSKKIARYYFDQIVNLLYDQNPTQSEEIKRQLITMRLIELGYDESQYLHLIEQRQNMIKELTTEQFISSIIQEIEVDDDEIKFLDVSFGVKEPEGQKVRKIVISDDLDPFIHFAHLMKQQHEESKTFAIAIDTTLKMCDICCSEKPEEQFYIRKSCSHSICKNCILDYINFKIDNSQVEQIKCFHSFCTESFATEEIEAILEGFELKIKKYHRIIQRNKIMQNPNNKFCTKPDCQGFITVNPQSTQPYQECNMCQTQICVKCYNQWHPRVSCSQNMEKSIQKYLEKNVVQLCPKCKIKIEKMTGCNHITCSFCKYEWCWLCKSKYSRSHFERFNPIGCPGFYKQKSDWPITKIYAYRFLCLIFWILYSAAIPILFFFYVSSRYGLLFIKKKRNSKGCKRVIFFTIGIIWFILGPALFPFHLIHYLYTIIAKNCKCCIKKKFVIEHQRPRNSQLFNLNDQRSLFQLRQVVNLPRRSLRVADRLSGSRQAFELGQIPQGSRILCRLQGSPYHINKPYPSRINENNLQNQEERLESQDSPYNTIHFSPQKHTINIPRFTQSPHKLSRKNIEINLVKQNSHVDFKDAKEVDSSHNKKVTFNKINRERRRPKSLVGIKSVKTNMMMEWKNSKFQTIQENVPHHNSQQNLDNIQEPKIPSSKSTQNLELQ